MLFEEPFLITDDIANKRMGDCILRKSILLCFSFKFQIKLYQSKELTKLIIFRQGTESFRCIKQEMEITKLCER